MIGVGHPDGRLLTGPMKAGEHGGVATVRLHPIARIPRNQRRRHHVAPMAEARELAMNAIAARASLIAKRQRLTGPPETVAQLADGISVIGNLAEIVHRAGASALRNRDRDPLLVNIQPTNLIWSIWPSPMHEALRRLAGLTLVPLHIG
ncbi:hypothetical protein MPLSOD_410009 [Mesorhizobium sp. SOD10]|nr:hypothetical protein MPLSOD_410009 [Mesorhizobium sp. SOD10]